MIASVLDILIYVFDRYMLEETPEVPEREDLARDLEKAGFAAANVERALDWLADLAGERGRPVMGDTAAGPAVRVYSDCELARLSTECRGFLMTLERLGVLSPQQREIVVDRMLALDADELDTEQLKWVVLMVLSSQPGQEQAFARMEAFAQMEESVHDATARPPH
jgi:Smg protein